MAVLERAFAGVQRNDPCPCGSGRKFKQCHGRPQPRPGWEGIAQSAVTIGGAVMG